MTKKHNRLRNLERDAARAEGTQAAKGVVIIVHPVTGEPLTPLPLRSDKPRIVVILPDNGRARGALPVASPLIRGE